MNNVVISGVNCTKKGVLMWCSACGPMGLSPTRADAMMVGNRHLEAHGIPTEEEQ